MFPFPQLVSNSCRVWLLSPQRGGGGVDMEEYARRMANSRCDGDHITLQALCDALKVRPPGERESVFITCLSLYCCQPP